MTDEQRAELAEHQREWGRTKARVELSLQRGEERLGAMLRGESPLWNPMELTDAEWSDVRLELEAWGIVLSRKDR
jgi:hypothetical protein